MLAKDSEARVSTTNGACVSALRAELARASGVSIMRVSHIVKGKRPVSADMALRLGRRFRQSPRFWLNLQARYDLDLALAEIGRPALSAIRPVNA